MGERKVLNKYYPPDFDPAKIPRRKQPKNLQIKVRMMLPMSIRCNTCGNYIYKGTKFNSRKEDVEGETYLGIQIFRFYFKCSKCSAELTMKTDPQNSDYTMEAGASRNYEPWRATDEATDEAVKKRETEELGDAMKALENRTLDSKQEMDIMAALDEMKSMRSRHANVGVEDMMAALRRTAAEREKEMEEQDEAILKSVVFQNSSKFVRRIDDTEWEEYYSDEESPLSPSETPEGRDLTKRRKIEADLRVSSGSGQVQATEVLANGMPEPEAKGRNGSTKAPSFAVRMKPVAFNIKPKKGSVSTSTKQLTKDSFGEQLTKDAFGDLDTVLPKPTFPSRHESISRSILERLYPLIEEGLGDGARASSDFYPKIKEDDPQSSRVVTSLGLAYGSDDDSE